MNLRAINSYWTVAGVIVIAAIVRCFIWLDSDVSWLLTLAEKIVAGARAYVDFFETNPPADILIYVPAVLIANTVGISAESALTVLVFLAAFSCLGLVALISDDRGFVGPREKPALFAIAFALLLILPGDNFAERENLALILIMPILAVYSERASGRSIPIVLASLAGIGAGVAISLKPYFALAIAFPLVYVAFKRRAPLPNLRMIVFSPEHWAIGLVVLVDAILLFWGYPDYIERILPIVLNLYAPLKYSLILMAINPSMILVATVALVGLGAGTHELRTPFVAISYLATLGFAGALLLQGKGWPYHGYPAVALSLFALALILLRRAPSPLGPSGSPESFPVNIAIGVVLFAGVYALSSYWFLQEPNRADLVAAVSRLAPPRPKVISISDGPNVAFPLTRKLHGIAVGRAPFQLISAYVDRMLTAGTLDPEGGRKVRDPATRQMIEGYGRQDRKELVDAIRTGRPDLVLIDGRAEKIWAFSHPEIAAALKPYHYIETIDGIEIWTQNKPSSDSTH